MSDGDWSTAEAAGQGEEEDLLPVCISCRAAVAVHERADGEWLCRGCYCSAMDWAWERARERGLT